ncbi:MAG: PhnD/SsuA/transferrin family substrate-binding protein [Candidatus Sedimenticola sp. (ex Thyasira tokunagai)]
MKTSQIFITALFCICVSFAGNIAYADDYKIGVLAKRGAANAVKKWGATVDYLTKKIQGDSFTLLPLDFEEVFPTIEAREVDFFLVNSSMFVTARVRYGADAIATMINSRQKKALKSFGGVIFTYIDRDDIQALSDIKGKQLMAVKESSLGGWQMAYKELVDVGINPKQDLAGIHFGGTHDNVVYAVQNGEVDVGTVRTDTLERMAAVGDIEISEFKIINAKIPDGFPFLISTSLYPEWPIAKLSTTSEAVAKRVADTLIEMKSDSAAAKSAKIVGWTAPLNYDAVEDMQKLLKVGAYE